jgi:hypothetical protein
MSQKPSETYSDAEATQRMNEAVRRALNTPHKPHAPLKAKPKPEPAKAATKRARKPA